MSARRALLVAYGAAVVPALVMALTQPVWSRIDEAQHADFIVQLSQGVYPAADQTLITPETLQVMETTGIFRGAAKGTYPAPDLSDIGPPPPGMSARANAVWMSRHLWQLSFEAVQTPGYYVLMVPVWLAADRLGGPFAAIYTIRAIDALLIAALAPMAVAVARVLSPNRPEIAALAALFAILLPGLDLNGTRIGNDAPGAVLGGLAVLLAVRWTASRWTWRRAALLGLVLGAAMMVKLTAAGLIPALVLALIWPRAGVTWSRRVGHAVVALGISVACLIPWFVLNLQTYGALLRGAGVARLSDALPSAFTASFVPFDLAVFDLTYWSGEPFGALPLAAPFAVLGGLLALMAIAGLVRLLRTHEPMPGGPLAVAIVAIGGMVAVALLLPATAGFIFAGPGRYAYPALPVAAALCAVGMCTVLQKAQTRRAVGGVYAVTAIGILGSSALGLPAPLQAGTGTPPPSARTVDVTASGGLPGFSITVDRVALDNQARAIWFEVKATNSGLGEVEWTVAPVASAGGVVTHGDYLRSTHLPGDIDAGQSASGWLFVPLDPALVRAGNTFHLRFADVAVTDYVTVRDIDLDVPLPGPAQ